MKHCSKCGNDLSQDARFCRSCGTPTNSDAPIEANAPNVAAGQIPPPTSPYDSENMGSKPSPVQPSTWALGAVLLCLIGGGAYFVSTTKGGNDAAQNQVNIVAPPVNPTQGSSTPIPPDEAATGVQKEQAQKEREDRLRLQRFEAETRSAEAQARMDESDADSSSVPSGEARYLKEGMSGDDVKQWQSFLIKQGFMEPPALGNFSDRTVQATISFQKEWDLYADGEVGPRTSEKAQTLGYAGAVVAGSNARPVVEDPAIFPGEGMGKISLEESRASVLKKLGKPTQSFVWDSQEVRQDTWTGKKSNSRLVVLYSYSSQAKDSVIQVETTSPKFFTAEGISINSSQSSVTNFLEGGVSTLYLRSKNSIHTGNYLVLYKSEKGVAFFQKEGMEGKGFEKIIVFPTLDSPLISSEAYETITSDGY